VFELPTGNVDASDPLTYLAEKTIHDGADLRVVSKQCIQLNYVAEVEGSEVVVNPEEHSEFIWAAKENVAGLDITEGMKGVLEDAFS
jgi:hypothetical protein